MTLSLSSPVSPITGLTTGGTSVTISGSGILETASVMFGGLNAPVTSQSETQLIVISPAHEVGAVDVVVSQVVPNPNDNWIDLTAGVPFYGVAVSDNGQYLLASNKNASTIRVSSDYGSTWTAHSLNNYVSGVAISSTGQRMYVLQYGAAPGLWRSSDYGATWEKLTYSWSYSLYPYEIACSGNGQVIIVTGGYNVSGGQYYAWSTNYGETFTLSGFYSLDNCVAAISSTGQYIYLSNSMGGYVRRSTDFGSNWSNQSLPAGNCWAVACSSDGSVVVATTVNKCYRSVNYGDTWTEVGSIPQTYKRLAGNASLTVLAAQSGNCYTSTDSGATWGLKRSNTGSEYIDVDGVGYRIALALSSPGNKIVLNDTSPTIESQTLTDAYTYVTSTTAQATKLSIETVGASNPTAQATWLSTEVLTTTDSPTAQATKLWVEMLASVQLAGPAQAILLNTETLGSVDAVIAEAWQLSTETLGNTTPTVLAETLWVEVLSSAADAPVIPVRFHEKVALLYGAKQDNLGILQTLAGSHAIAGLNLSFEDVINTTTHEFGENCVGRSAAVSLENLTRTVSFETLFPTVDPTSEVAETSLALTDWFKACGASATLSSNELQFNNETADDTRLTVEVQQIPENATEAKQNSYKILDSFGIVGLDLTSGRLGKLKFSFSGNPQLPVYTDRLTPNFGQQKLNVLGPIKRPNVLTASLLDLDSNVQTDFCFYKLQTDSLFGFDLVQSQLSDQELFDRVPKPTPLALTVMVSVENSILAATPEYCIGRRYSMHLSFGLLETPIILEFTELQMADYKRTVTDGVVGLAVGFMNTGFTKLTFTWATE